MTIYQYSTNSNWYMGAEYFFNIDYSVKNARHSGLTEESPSSKDILILKEE